MGNYATFKQAFYEADKGGVDMGVMDWAVAVGLAHDYGHGVEWEGFTKSEAVAKIEAYAAAEGEDEDAVIDEMGVK